MYTGFGKGDGSKFPPGGRLVLIAAMEQPEGPELQRVSTTKMMKDQAQRAPMVLLTVLLVNGCCCFWIPLLFFVGASNVLKDCERYDAFTLWMKTYTLVPMAMGVLMQLLVAVLACVGSGSVYKLGLRLQFLTSFVAIGYVVWGWFEYFSTEEETCVGDGEINPRSLALVFLILASLSVPGAMLTAIKKGCAKDVNRKEIYREPPPTLDGI